MSRAFILSPTSILYNVGKDCKFLFALVIASRHDLDKFIFSKGQPLQFEGICGMITLVPLFCARGPMDMT